MTVFRKHQTNNRLYSASAILLCGSSGGLRCEIFGHGNNDGKSKFHIYNVNRRIDELLLFIATQQHTYISDNVLNVLILGERFNLIAYIIMGRRHMLRWRNIRLQIC